MAKTRSPNFPSIPLELAVQRSRTIWDQEGRHEAAPETLVDHWGYGPKSSGGRSTLAALRHFGLLEGRGAVRLTELAQAILFSEEGSDQWLRRVRDAAVRPTIHKEILAKYGGGLPSEQNLRYYLVVERGFSESGAAELIEEVRATFAYAKMDEWESGNLPQDDADKPEDVDGMSVGAAPALDASPVQRGSRRAVQLPYSATEWAVLQAPFPLSRDEWDRMLAVLQAMKPGLVASGEPAQALPDDPAQ